jgi:hypothetical protein
MKEVKPKSILGRVHVFLVLLVLLEDDHRIRMGAVTQVCGVGEEGMRRGVGEGVK